VGAVNTARRRRGTVRGRWPVAVVVGAAAIVLATVWVQPAAAIISDPTDNPCISSSTASLSVSKHSMLLGETAEVSGDFTPGPKCLGGVTTWVEFRSGVGGVKFRQAGGTNVVTPQASGTYVLVAFNGGYLYDMAADSVKVTLPVVNGHPLASITRGGEQAALFAQGVNTPNAVVAIRGDVDLDLSYFNDLNVAAGVQIIGRRDAAHPNGPHVFTTTRPQPLLQIGNDLSDPAAPADNVRITGIRFEGGESTDPCDEAGRTDDSDAVDVFSSKSIEIDNNEFSRWSGSAVQVLDRANRIQRQNAATVLVHDNYIHDNQHPTYCGLDPFGSGHGGGYGVSVNVGGFTRITHNVFDRNRHAIAANGADGDGYFAVGNLFMRPGLDDEKLWIDSMNHQIDVHGQTKDCPGTFESFACGPAGEFFDVELNTVLGFDIEDNTNPAIQLRGTPTSYDPATNDGGMFVDNNVFAQSLPNALTQTEHGLVDGGHNKFMVDPIAFWEPSGGNGPSCDFDGDGTPDPFRASAGVWWYRSSLQGSRWLSQVPPWDSAMKPADPTLGDVNGDGLCDVTHGGTTSFTKPPFESFSSLSTTVQNVVGTTAANAGTIIVQSGLVVGTVAWVADKAPAGTVIWQDQPAKRGLQVGSVVNLRVSLG